jgi:hypothetical protein
MKFGLVSAIAVVACLFIFKRADAQSASSYHQLSAEEFSGIPEANSGDVVANINCYIDFNYRAQSEKGNYHLICEIRLVFNKNGSWINKKRVLSPSMMEDILNHEQGHYAIAYMEQQELLRTVNKTRFDANYQYEASALFDRIHEKYKQLSVNYDDDTRHMLDHQQQHSWDVYFKKRLEYMPLTELARN